MTKNVVLPVNGVCVIKKWFVSKGSSISQGSVLCSYKSENDSALHKLKSTDVGSVVEILVGANSKASPG